jgi:dTDP-4-dehydrorhamnose 3,5-epimerase
LNNFALEKTPIEGLQVIQRQPVRDVRGFFERLFCTSELTALLGRRNIAQINHSITKKLGMVRGMHYQRPPHAEMKFVTCVRGKVFDVAVDLREGSPTFLRWHAEVLSEENHRTFCIPEGFAHGFQTLTDNCELIYLHSAAYNPDAEAGLNALDPSTAISWPLPVTGCSSRDRGHTMLTSDFSGLKL